MIVYIRLTSPSLLSLIARPSTIPVARELLSSLAVDQMRWVAPLVGLIQILGCHYNLRASLYHAAHHVDVLGNLFERQEKIQAGLLFLLPNQFHKAMNQNNY